MNGKLDRGLQDGFEAAGRSLKMGEGCEELDPLLDAWLSTATFA